MTGVTLYVCTVPAHTLSDPLIAAGALGALPGTIFLVRAIDGPPHPVAVTEMVPALAPMVTRMLLVLELPVQPDGSVQA